MTTVGALVTAVAPTVLRGAYRRKHPPAMALRAVASATDLTAIDAVYVQREVIPPIYLGEAGVEVVLILAWAVGPGLHLVVE